MVHWSSLFFSNWFKSFPCFDSIDNYFRAVFFSATARSMIQTSFFESSALPLCQRPGPSIDNLEFLFYRQACIRLPFERNRMKQDGMGQWLRLTGWDCFRKSRWVTVHDLQMHVGDISHWRSELIFPVHSRSFKSSSFWLWVKCSTG
jgi:hypothetical protein